MLGDIRPVVRSFLTGDRELRLKGGLRRFFKSHSVTNADVFIHASAWKNASQWLRLVLSDPRLFSCHDFTPTPRSESRSDKRKPMYLAVPSSPDTVPVDLRNCSVSGIYVYRDPVAQARSWYVSTRYTHPKNPNLIKMRVRLDGMDDITGFSRYMDLSYQSVAEPMGEWAEFARSHPGIVVVKYEDLIGYSRETLSQALQEAGWDIKQARLESVLETYKLNHLKPKIVKQQKYVNNKISNSRLPSEHVENVLRSTAPNVFDTFSKLEQMRLRVDSVGI